MPDRIAQLALALRPWTGWSREQPAPYSANVGAHRGQALTVADFGISADEVASYAQIFPFRIRIMTLLADRAWFEYRHLVIPNPGGGINLFGPFAGTVLLRIGQHIELATPTMDGGLFLTLALSAIEDTPADQP